MQSVIHSRFAHTHNAHSRAQRATTNDFHYSNYVHDTSLFSASVSLAKDYYDNDGSGGGGNGDGIDRLPKLETIIEV